VNLTTQSEFQISKNSQLYAILMFGILPKCPNPGQELIEISHFGNLVNLKLLHFTRIFLLMKLYNF